MSNIRNRVLPRTSDIHLKFRTIQIDRLMISLLYFIIQFFKV